MSDDDRPKLDITDVPARAPASSAPQSQRPYLSVMFNCCKIYQRVYQNPDGETYQGRCPKCLRTIRFVVGPGGTNERSFVVE